MVVKLRWVVLRLNYKLKNKVLALGKTSTGIFLFLYFYYRFVDEVNNFIFFFAAKAFA